MAGISNKTEPDLDSTLDDFLGSVGSSPLSILPGGFIYPDSEPEIDSQPDSNYLEDNGNTDSEEEAWGLGDNSESNFSSDESDTSSKKIRIVHREETEEVNLARANLKADILELAKPYKLHK